MYEYIRKKDENITMNSVFLLSSKLSGWGLAGCIALIVVCLALILFLIFRKSSYTKTAVEGEAPDSLVGETGTVIETVDADAGTGLVDINGEEWAARSVYTDDVYEAESVVVVVAVEGVKVIVKQA